jgi:hypothetical protein
MGRLHVHHATSQLIGALFERGRMRIYVKAKKKICGFPVSSYKNLGRVGRFN